MTFWRVLREDGQTIVRHLERHEPGAILHAVYEGDPDSLSLWVPLAEYRETASIETLLMIDATVFGSRVQPVRPVIELGDSVSDDPKATAETLALLEQAAAISTSIKVKMQHPDWDDPDVLEEVRVLVVVSAG